MEQLAAIDANIQQLLGQLRAQGVLDDQFSQLMQLQDETNPDFVEEVVQLYFEDAAAKIVKIEAIMAAAAPDFVELDAVVHQFKGSSASLGAQAIARLCIRLREACQSRNAPAVHGLLNEVGGCGIISCRTVSMCSFAMKA